MAKLALLIGVSEYAQGFNALPAAAKDVEAMRRVLLHPEMGGFDSVQPLINPDLGAMQEAIEVLFKNRQRDDLVLLFFSGHGVKDASGKLYLATSLTRKTTQGELLKSTAVSTSFIHEVMDESRSRHQAIVLDCCFSGAFAKNLLAKDDGSVDVKAQLGGEGRVVLTSSTSTQYSFEQKDTELSIYTHYLVEGIETGAADLNSSGAISADELHDYAKRRVKEAVPAMQPEIYVVKEGFKLLLAKARIRDPQLRYRAEVERVAAEGVILPPDRPRLDDLCMQLGLLRAEADDIEVKVLKAYRVYQESLEQYKIFFLDAVKKGYPLSDGARNKLKELQERWQLKSEDILQIERQIDSPSLPSGHAKSNIPSSSIEINADNPTKKLPGKNHGYKKSKFLIVLPVLLLGFPLIVVLIFLRLLTSFLWPSFEEVDIASSGCSITIENPLVSLNQKPDNFSRELVKVPSGSYEPSAHGTRSSWVMGEEAWFHVEVEGRKGWIKDDTFNIDGKSIECP
ncbi:Clp protease [filamentous cyanobacterium CCP3]|nr:Clp protease [filamentous cyanobacterium CCP3]